MNRHVVLKGFQWLKEGKFSSLVYLILPLTLYCLLRALTLFNKRIRHSLMCSSFSEFVGWGFVKWFPVAVNYRGFKFLIKFGDLKGVPLGLFSNEFEKHEIEYLSNLQKLFGRFRTVMDVGAHVGLYTLPLSRLAEKVIAVEPLEEALRVLVRSLLLNKITNVRILPYAALSMNSELTFWIQDLWGLSRITPSVPTGVTRIRKVKTITIDSLRLDNLDFLKVDVEGHELHVLKGAKETIIRCRPIILLELWPENHREVESFLSEVGYQLVDMGFSDYRINKNFLAVPNELLTKIIVKPI